MEFFAWTPCLEKRNIFYSCEGDGVMMETGKNLKRDWNEEQQIPNIKMKGTK